MSPLVNVGSTRCSSFTLDTRKGEPAHLKYELMARMRLLQDDRRRPAFRMRNTTSPRSVSLGQETFSQVKDWEYHSMLRSLTFCK